MSSKNRKKTIIGKFILDSISMGMYNDPLMLYREYIQNSTDSIDILLADNRSTKEKAKIEIRIDGVKRSVLIKDNGAGLRPDLVWSTLHNIGRSSKKANVNRGFRGIGRLGGLAYCDQLKFITKAKGEAKYSVSLWDCNKLRELINEEKGFVNAESVIFEISKIFQKQYEGNKKDHFFAVELQNVKSSRDVLLNVPMVRSYIAQVAPVPFNASKFKYAQVIKDKLQTRIPSHCAYNIFVNDEKIFKPYENTVSISKNMRQEIKGIDFIELKQEDKCLGFGWIADIDLLGIISRSSAADGIRLRNGNILVGDKSLLSNFFREKRFNNYLIGEIHTLNNKLILNSRRDDFEDNAHKEEFYSSFAREIGIPLSQKIRETSEKRSNEKRKVLECNLIKTAKKIHRRGHLSKLQKQRIVSELHQAKKKQNTLNIVSVDSLIEKVNSSNHYLESNFKKIPGSLKSIIKSIFDIVYAKCQDKKEAEEIISTIVKKID